MSANRTPVQLVAIEPVARAETIDPLLHASLLGLEPRELVLALRERAQIFGDERAHRAAALGRADSRGAVDVLWNGDGDVGHCASQYHRYTGTGAQPQH